MFQQLLQQCLTIQCCPCPHFHGLLAVGRFPFSILPLTTIHSPLCTNVCVCITDQRKFTEVSLHGLASQRVNNCLNVSVNSNCRCSAEFLLKDQQEAEYTCESYRSAVIGFSRQTRGLNLSANILCCLPTYCAARDVNGVDCFLQHSAT